MQNQLETLLESHVPLDELDEFVWKLFLAATTEGGHPFASGVFATVSQQNGHAAAQARTVILRQANRLNTSLDFYTDARSPKVTQLANAGVSWLFYDRESKIQIRATGYAQILDGDEATEAWKTIPLASRDAYLSISAPSNTISGQDARTPPANTQFSQTDTEKGRDNFRIVRTIANEVELLFLRDRGHIRARLNYSEGQCDANWLIP